MKFHQMALLFFVWLPMQVFAQTKIVGTVHDEKSNLPIEFASIYINGTTQGTNSDASGNFHLEKIKLPCVVVVSRIGYYAQSINIKDSGASHLVFLMKPKENTIHEISVADKNLRAKNLEIFRAEFLGTDVWGRYATIENEEVIQFSKDYETKQTMIADKIIPRFLSNDAIEIEWSEDSTQITYKIGVNLKASANAPLKINLPLLGYTINYDLVEFIWQYHPGLNSMLCSNLGYFYFHQNTPDSKRDSIRIRNNRIKNYYNSAQHFCKSLFDKKLLQNGFKLYEDNPDESTVIKLYEDNPDESTVKKLKEANLDSNIQIQSNYAKIIGLQNRKLNILYYTNWKGSPVDLTKKKRMSPSPIKSVIVFRNDTCIIRDNGTVPDNSIVFGPAIGLKRIGSMLPENYLPSN